MNRLLAPALATLLLGAAPAPEPPEAIGLEVPFLVRDLQAVDLEGSGRHQLLLVTSSGVWLVDPRHADPAPLPVRLPARSRGWTSASVGDVNGDGRDDVALVTFEPYARSELLTWADEGGLVRLAPTQPGVLRIGEEPGPLVQASSGAGPLSGPLRMGRLEARTTVRGPAAGLVVDPTDAQLPHDNALGFVGWPGDGAVLTTDREGHISLQSTEPPHLVLWRSPEPWSRPAVRITWTQTDLLDSPEELQIPLPPRPAALPPAETGPRAALPWTDTAANPAARYRRLRGGSLRLLEHSGGMVTIVGTSPIIGIACAGAAFLPGGDGEATLLAAAYWLRKGPTGGRSTIVLHDPADLSPIP